MRTVTFKSVLHGVAIRLGLEPDVNLLSNQAASLTEYINEAVREGGEKFDFPELCPIEEREYRAAWSAATTYVAGDEVWQGDDETYYVCILGHANQEPPNATYWEEVGDDFDKYIAYAQTGETAIGELFNVWTADPRISRTYPEIGFFLSTNGFQVALDAPSQVFIYYRKRMPVFTSTVWASGTFTVGDIVYYPTTGECYINIAASTTQAPTDTSKWTKIDFPYVLSSYVKLMAYADALAEADQHDKAKLWRERADDRLMDEFEKVVSQQRQFKKYEVRTS